MNLDCTSRWGATPGWLRYALVGKKLRRLCRRCCGRPWPGNWMKSGARMSRSWRYIARDRQLAKQSCRGTDGARSPRHRSNYRHGPGGNHGRCPSSPLRQSLRCKLGADSETVGLWRQSPVGWYQQTGRPVPAALADPWGTHRADPIQRTAGLGRSPACASTYQRRGRGTGQQTGPHSIGLAGPWPPLRPAVRKSATGVSRPPRKELPLDRIPSRLHRIRRKRDRKLGRTVGTQTCCSPWAIKPAVRD